MKESGRGPDFIAVDGGEGGTGAAPLTFADHVSLPFKIGFVRVYRIFQAMGISQDVVWIGAGKLGFPDRALIALAMGCDLIYVAREAMISIGCIQAQACHTGHCPAGIATQNKWLMSGLDPTYKAARLANYVATLRKELLQLSHACGRQHPALVTTDHFTILDDHFGGMSARECFHYEADWGVPSQADRDEIVRLMLGEQLDIRELVAT